jgi:23S rRNA (cytidine2498-2'-O)-methyltransferase
LDVVLVEPNQWIVGWHQIKAIEDSWPGGVFPVSVPVQMVSRAYLKTAEAVAWSRLPIVPGDRIVEIGSSPGGASQRFLDLGLEVTGIDPAEMNPLVLQHPRFTHWRSKSSGIKRKRYGTFKWLSADANVAPNYTLDAIEDIVTYPASCFEGLLLTIKLSSFKLVGRMDDYLARIRSWGFPQVKVRQLATNRRECCVAASRRVEAGVFGK